MSEGAGSGRITGYNDQSRTVRGEAWVRNNRIARETMRVLNPVRAVDGSGEVLARAGHEQMIGTHYFAHQICEAGFDWVPINSVRRHQVCALL